MESISELSEGTLFKIRYTEDWKLYGINDLLCQVQTIKKSDIVMLLAGPFQYKTYVDTIYMTVMTSEGSVGNLFNSSVNHIRDIEVL